MMIKKTYELIKKEQHALVQIRDRIGKKPVSPTVMMIVICLGIFVAAMDQTVIYGALPGIMKTIGVPILEFDKAAWIVIGYLLGFTFALPLIGRVSDVYGHSRVYILSLLIFMGGSILVALSTSIYWAVGARILQAVGGGALVPVAMAITSDLYTGRNRAVALGIIGAVVEAGGAIGPFYGALFAEFWQWQWIFWLNVPISVVILSVVFFKIRPGTRTKGKVDYLSALYLAIGLSFFCLGISRQFSQEGYLFMLIGFVALAIVFFVLFFLRCRRIEEPLVKLSTFKNAVYSAANLTNLFVGGALIIAMVNIPLMSEALLGCSAVEGGLRLLRFTIMLSLGALAGGFLCKRFGYRLPTIAGLIMSAAGFWFMSRWTLEIADPQLTLHLALCGFGFGLVIAPLGTAALDSVGSDQKGMASSMVVMARMIGMMIGMAAITAWGMERFHLETADLSMTDIYENPEALRSNILSLFNNFFTASLIVCAAALVPTIWLRKKRKSS
jgi:EmrB/QacA subfamily drug resistance transporter